MSDAKNNSSDSRGGMVTRSVCAPVTFSAEVKGKQLSPDRPTHNCAWCGLQFYCNIVVSKKTCKCAKLARDFKDINDKTVMFTFYFCDLYCFDNFIRNSKE